ncbi:MAG: biopolymer transporter ExbD [Planctomycetota bacterium]|nr:MAG: biopolymer transporter ExbD [Planctomycetota bacterium]
MPLKTSVQEELPTVNLTPMIDVVFLLIVFFMVGTQFADDRSHIELQLPGVGRVDSAGMSPVRSEVAVAATGQILLDGTAVSLDELTQRLRNQQAEHRGIQVVVRADGQATHQQVAAVYAAVSRAGVANLKIAVQTSQPQWR